ncbi:MAG: tRNA epoxyqueuosine(34) reductase QueG [Muribaculaceae bacterium]|nr:tRNA epoxyqueuosine(34) reductase QueG [Muribaculaceae bacterium]
MHHEIAAKIREFANTLGFDACGMARACQVNDDVAQRYDKWIETGRNGCMQWTRNHRELRNDPTLLLPGAKTVIVFALNYYPDRVLPPEAPQFAYYAYGEDYHKVIRRKLKVISHYIEDQTGEKCRICVDSAPIHERYWARVAGLGFIGLNNSLILPGKGSYFFLGTMLTTLELEPDKPCTQTCGKCRLCFNRCPTGALSEGSPVDAGRCLSCLTIEYDGELPEWTSKALGNRIYGCDTCQQCCPHNRHATPTKVAEFQPKLEFMNLTHTQIQNMTEDEFSSIFGKSAVKRAGLERLKRNLAASEKYKK